jgi:hypothetical protein
MHVMQILENKQDRLIIDRLRDPLLADQASQIDDIFDECFRSKSNLESSRVYGHTAGAIRQHQQYIKDPLTISDG